MIVKFLQRQIKCVNKCVEFYIKLDIKRIPNQLQLYVVVFNIFHKHFLLIEHLKFFTESINVLFYNCTPYFGESSIQLKSLLSEQIEGLFI